MRILNGGTTEWTAFNALETPPAKPRPAGTVTLKDANPGLFIGWTAVYDDAVSRRDPNVVLLDARPAHMYSGKVIRHSVIGGHLPGALNLSSLDGTDGESGQWKDDASLAARYSAIPRDRRIYVYCHDGPRMGLAYLQLQHWGHRDPRLYNGGRSHWGNEPTRPTIKRTEPFDEAYAL